MRSSEPGLDTFVSVLAFIWAGSLSFVVMRQCVCVVLVGEFSAPLAVSTVPVIHVMFAPLALITFFVFV